MKPWIASGLLCAALLMTGPVQADERLYEQLGGRPGIELIVDEFLEALSRDLRVVARFADTNIERFHRMLVEQICELSGGPCEYSGDSMVLVHTGMDISEAEFNAVVENLMLAMERASLPLSAQNRLLAKLAPLRAEIIHR
ncbi:MAG TPA: group 1 truncated hemoglobin [Thioalkalivibrio sp.]|nr:group 1 truncated hemoglobin [Thioalkalivibrio sp.]